MLIDPITIEVIEYVRVGEYRVRVSLSPIFVTSKAIVDQLIAIPAADTPTDLPPESIRTF
jgi:hypothetical protein